MSDLDAAYEAAVPILEADRLLRAIADAPGESNIKKTPTRLVVADIVKKVLGQLGVDPADLTNAKRAKVKPYRGIFPGSGVLERHYMKEGEYLLVPVGERSDT